MGKLSDKIDILQTKVATEALQKELANVKDELKQTRVNATETDALQGHANIFICQSCKFAKEPTGMQRNPGMVEQARDLAFN